MIDGDRPLASARQLSEEDYRRCVPVHVVWEITLACDLKCLHCGSRAGRKRPYELTTEECLDVVRSIARLGTREVSLIGGEAYLRRDWTTIIRAIRSHGMYCAVQTGGRNLSPDRLRAAVDAGLNGLGVSLDGLAQLHDRVRNVPGSFSHALDALRRAHDLGLETSVNTQVGAETMTDLPELMETIIGAGAKQWQVQITVAMGNATDNAALLMQPYQLLELMPLLARLYQSGIERGLTLAVGNNIGYFGPYEHILRGFGNEKAHWIGCTAGQTVLALEADGTVKGCPSLATASFGGGNIRDTTLEQLWTSSEKITFGQLRSTSDLWGFCKSCYYADVCLGGCTWTAHSLLGEPGNNPYCHYRALELEKAGLRERIVKVREAAEKPFAIGQFDIITERICDGATIATTSTAEHPVKKRVKVSTRASGSGRVALQLDVCRGCHCYIFATETTCPHCKGNVEVLASSHAEATKTRAEAIFCIEQTLAEKKLMAPS